jgi:hypothetical protein
MRWRARTVGPIQPGHAAICDRSFLILGASMPVPQGATQRRLISLGGVAAPHVNGWPPDAACHQTFRTPSYAKRHCGQRP